VTDAATRADADGARVSIDLSSVATMRELGDAELRRILAEVRPDVVFANQEEAQTASQLDLAPEGVYVIKRGPAPVLVGVDGQAAAVPVDRVDDVLDSTGAGDAFAAGYIVAALCGADPYESARAGSVLAMSALRRPGAL